MLVVVADDNSDTLNFVSKWFERAYSTSAEMRLKTHNNLDDLEDVIATNLQSPDQLLLFLDLDWGNDKVRSLKWISRVKRSAQTRHWPVLIYSESADEGDVRDAHDHYANGYIHKGEDEQEAHFISVLEHWRSRQILPSL